MTDKITLATVSELQAFPSAAAAINSNSAIITAAIDNTLSRDGTAPNQMLTPLDMNSQQILNLPNPSSPLSPLRLQDLNSFIGGGSINTVPSGGTTGQSLQKHSNANYDMTWGNNVTSVGLSLPADFTVTGSPVTTSGTLSATLTNTPTGTGGFVRATGPTLVTPNLGTPSGAILTNATGLPVSTGVTGLGTGVAAFLGTPTSAGLAAILPDETGTGALVFGTGPTITLANGTGLPIAGLSGLGTGVGTFLGTPTSANLRAAMTDESGTGALIFAGGALGAATATSINGSTVSPGHYTGEPSNAAAVSGEIGEYISSTVVSGSAVSLTSTNAANVTSISVPAGDWTIGGVGAFLPGASTNVTQYAASIGTTTATLNLTPGQLFALTTPAYVPGAVQTHFPVPTFRFSFSTTTTVFLVAQGTFTVSTLGAFGYIWARRAR